MAHGIQISWQEATLGCTFNIYKGTSAGGEDMQNPISSGSTATAFQDNNGTPGTRYFYKVTALLAGIESSAVETTAIFPMVPDPVTNLTAVPV